VVGRENVIAGADCGFASFAISKDSQEMQREIVWHKLVSLVEGARLATRELWGRAS
jgi:5-methyltetrahydropteroyltriglutamate--homocysteine methyltransferase